MTKHSTRTQLERYAALSAAFLTSSTAVDAGVVYTDVDPDAIAMNSAVFIDMNGDAVNDFNVNHIDTFSSATSFIYSLQIGQLFGSGSNYGFVAVPGYGLHANALASGATISSGAGITTNTWATLGIQYYVNSFGSIFSGAFGVIDGAGETFVGVSFEIGGNTHYGWIRMEMPADHSFVRVIDFAYEDVPNTPIAAGDMGACSSNVAPANPTHVHAGNSVTLSWDPISQSVACQVQGTRLVPAGPSPKRNIFGLEPSSITVPYNVLGLGTTWEWSVRCACSIPPDPIDATPFSVTDTFSVPTPRIAGAGADASVSPNPTEGVTRIDLGEPTARETEIRVLDLMGRVVDWIRVPADVRVISMDFGHVEAGQYIVQVGDMEGMPLEVTH